MSFFASNIKLLRRRRGRTQEEAAFSLNMKRSTLSGYENEVAQPGLDALVVFSKYYSISIDTLVKVDLENLSESHLVQIERGNDVFVTGGNLRVLATTTDHRNEENIELVSEKAKAGYRTGFADPEFIKVLPVFHMPFLSKQKKYRTFEISGDSMQPIPEGSWVTCEFLQNWNLIQDRHAYIIHTLNDGVVFKVVENLISSKGVLRLYSLNSIYEPYEVHINEIREVWKFVNFISSELPPANSPLDRLTNQVASMQEELSSLKQSLPPAAKKSKTGNLFD